MMSNSTTAIVIGAGAVGVCCAYYLAERGIDVTLVDRGDVCAGCSYGNSGLLVPSHSVPLAAPGVIWRALRWMAKPDSPFYIRPRPSPSLVSWLWKFRAACSEENVERAMPVLRDLTMTGVELFRELDDACESDFGLGTAGVSYVYRTEEGLANGRKEAAHIAKVGLQAEELDRDGVREFAGLETTAIGGMLHPYDGHVTPGKYVHALAEVFERGGGRIERHTAVRASRPTAGVSAASSPTTASWRPTRSSWRPAPGLPPSPPGSASSCPYSRRRATASGSAGRRTRPRCR